MTGTNPSGIEPMEFNVLVEAFEVENKTKGGLLLPDDHVDKVQFAQTRGRLVAVSAGAFSDLLDRAEPGETVIYAKHVGVFVDGADGKRYKLIKDKDVLARVAA